MQQNHETYELARKRVRQKKRLYWHFVIFVIGAVFLFILNEVLLVGKDWGDWFVWAVTAWFFLWFLHFSNVFFMRRFFGKEWERRETEKLLQKHEKKLQQLEKKLVKEGAISPDENSKTTEI